MRICGLELRHCVAFPCTHECPSYHFLMFLFRFPFRTSLPTPLISHEGEKREGERSRSTTTTAQSVVVVTSCIGARHFVQESVGERKKEKKRLPRSRESSPTRESWFPCLCSLATLRRISERWARLYAGSFRCRRFPWTS